MNNFRNFICFVIVVMVGITLPLPSVSKSKIYETVDCYKFTMNLKVPIIVDNMQSLGKRVYKVQRLIGTLLIKYKNGYYPEYEIIDLVNKSYKISGKNVTYTCITGNDYTMSRLNYIGNNKTNIFKTPTSVFYLAANPSYNIGDDSPDNTLLLMMSGKGISLYKKSYDATVINYLHGYAAGQIGCGCYAYGHKSPTRVASDNGPNLNNVEDIAAVFGNWRAIFGYRFYRMVDP